MSVDDYRWHYDYARLAWDLGFTFQTLREKPSLDRNIGHINIEQVIRERDVATIERHIGTVIEYNLDNDQTSVLDPNFVKIFRLSQLSAQYLLFCKKYLDNTVVLLKKEFIKNNDESKNLKRYVEELKQEVVNSRKQIKELKSALNCQIASTQNTPVHQCNDCPKAFSTEEYLLAHIKRRHDSNQGTSSTSFQAETDKLQLEIKELKERLNNTEKFIHSDEPNNLKRDVSTNSLGKINSTENSVLVDLQQKFELLKSHVENELRILQTQKFDQDKYEQWFEKFLSKLELTRGNEIEAFKAKAVPNNNIEATPPLTTVVNNADYPVSHDQKQNVIVVESKGSAINMDEVIKNDEATQTDFTPPKESLICKSCQVKSSTVEEPTQVEPPNLSVQSVNNNDNMQIKLHTDTENHLEEFEKMLENKVTGSIEKLENQMQDFWNKIQEVEKQNTPITQVPAIPRNDNKSNSSTESINVKPSKVIPKPRKKILTKEAVKSALQKSNDSFLNVKPKPREIVKSTTVKLTQVPVIETVTFKEAGINFNSNSDSESEVSEESETSESSDEETDDSINNTHKLTAATIKPSNTSTLGQRSLTSLKEAAFTPEVLEGLQKEVENVLNSRLEEIGISPEWSTLPIRSYHRALNIVTHQANLIQKNITNYMHLRGQILKDVDKQVLQRRKDITPQKHSKLKSLLSNVRNKTKAIVPKEKSYNKPKTAKIDTVIVHSQKSKTAKTRIPKKEEQKDENKTKPDKKMYETDGDSDSSAIGRKNTPWNRLKITDSTQKAYFDVIQELNTTVNSKSKLDQESSSDISEHVAPTQPEIPLDLIKKDDIESGNADFKIETQAKGVLKNYPSVGSLQKKKVLFDLESSASDNKEPPKPPTVPVETNYGGSTTSIASSVLDGSKTNLMEKSSEKKSNDLSDVSDWEISDILD